VKNNNRFQNGKSSNEGEMMSEEYESELGQAIFEILCMAIIPIVSVATILGVYAIIFWLCISFLNLIVTY